MQRFSILLFAFSLFIAQSSTAQSVTIDLNTELQTIRGFGGMNHTVWINDLNEDVRSKAFDNTPGKLGLSILRVHIDPNDDLWNLEIPTATYAKSQGALVFASPWDPPSELLDPAASYNRLLPSNYNAYVDHLNAFGSFMSTNGAQLYSISVQNEPDYGEPGGWTDWTSDEMVNFMRDHAQNINSLVMAPESFQFIRPYSDAILNDVGARDNLDILGGHIYGGGLFDYPLARNLGKEVWMTEHYTTSDRSANLWPDALLVGEEIHQCMEANFNAYVWWYIRRSYGLITDDGNISKRGYVFSQFSKFIRPGFTRVGVTNGSNVDITAYKLGATVVIVAVNNTNSPANLDFTVQNGTVNQMSKITTSSSMNLVNEGSLAVASGNFSATVEARSIVTFTTNPNSTGKANNIEPIAMAGDDVMLTDEDNNGVESITLDATASTDEDGTIVNYSWALDGDQISFAATETLNLPTGVHEITLTVTDDDGATSTDTRTVTVNLPETANEIFFWLDAECGEVGTNWQEGNDTGASNGKYIAASPGVQRLNEPSEDAADLVSFTFEVTEAGSYRAWGRVRVPSADDDSFWVRMDDGEWTLWNSITGGNAFGWDDIHDSNNVAAPVTYPLDVGTHTFYIGLREDGADLDKVLLTNTGITPDGVGGDSDICPDEPDEPVTSIDNEKELSLNVYPNPATNELTVQWEKGYHGIKIFDLNGRLTEQFKFDERATSRTLPLQIESGVYLMEIDGVNAKVMKRLLIE